MGISKVVNGWHLLQANGTDIAQLQGAEFLTDLAISPTPEFGLKNDLIQCWTITFHLWTPDLIINHNYAHNMCHFNKLCSHNRFWHESVHQVKTKVVNHFNAPAIPPTTTTYTHLFDIEHCGCCLKCGRSSSASFHPLYSCLVWSLQSTAFHR